MHRISCNNKFHDRCRRPETLTSLTVIIVCLLLLASIYCSKLLVVACWVLKLAHLRQRNRAYGMKCTNTTTAAKCTESIIKSKQAVSSSVLSQHLNANTSDFSLAEHSDSGHENLASKKSRDEAFISLVLSFSEDEEETEKFLNHNYTAFVNAVDVSECDDVPCANVQVCADEVCGYVSWCVKLSTAVGRTVASNLERQLFYVTPNKPRVIDSDNSIRYSTAQHEASRAKDDQDESLSIKSTGRDVPERCLHFVRSFINQPPVVYPVVSQLNQQPAGDRKPDDAVEKSQPINAQKQKFLSGKRKINPERAGLNKTMEFNDHKTTGSAVLVHVSPNDRVDPSTQTPLNLSVVEVRKRWTKVKFRRDTPGLSTSSPNNSNKRADVTEQMRTTFLRFQTFSMSEYWIGRPVELGRLLALKGFYLVKEEEQWHTPNQLQPKLTDISNAKKTRLQVRCAFCQRTSSLPWSSRHYVWWDSWLVDIYRIVFLIRLTHDKRSSSCSMSLELMADNFLLTKEQESDVATAVETDMYALFSSRSVKSTDKTRLHRQDSDKPDAGTGQSGSYATSKPESALAGWKDQDAESVSLSESAVTEVVEAMALSVPDYMPEDEDQWIIPLPSLVNYRTFLEYETSQLTKAVIYAPSYIEQVSTDKHQPTEFLEFDAAESALARRCNAPATKDWCADRVGRSERLLELDSGIGSGIGSGSGSGPMSFLEAAEKKKMAEWQKTEEAQIVTLMSSNSLQEITSVEPLFPRYFTFEARYATFAVTSDFSSDISLRGKATRSINRKDELKLASSSGNQTGPSGDFLGDSEIGTESSDQLQLRFGVNSKKLSWNEMEQSVFDSNRKPPVNADLPKLLASAGFVFLQRDDDLCVCFWCGLVLKDWVKAGEKCDPFIEHARHCFNCPYVLLHRGKQFVVDTLELYPPYNSKISKFRLEDVLVPTTSARLLDNLHFVQKRLLQSTDIRRVKAEMFNEVAYNCVLHFDSIRDLRISKRELLPRMQFDSIRTVCAMLNIQPDVVSFLIEMRLRRVGDDFRGAAELVEAFADLCMRKNITSIVTGISIDIIEFIDMYQATKASSSGKQVDSETLVGGGTTSSDEPNKSSSGPTGSQGRAQEVQSELGSTPDSNAQTDAAPEGVATPRPKSSRLCLICRKRKSNIALLPCGHISVCDKCFTGASSVANCPKKNCSFIIRDSFRIYKA